MSGIQILVVGGASLDTLECASEQVAGGAGMYTAMAAWQCGAAVTLYAPRPEPMPKPLETVAARLDWLGPSIELPDLARFEISYSGNRTTYVNAHFGAELSLTEDLLPADLSNFDVVHLVPLGDIARQRRLLHACRSGGATCISAGTAFDLINEQPDEARAVLDAADIFFLNEAEAGQLFGSLAQVRSRVDQAIFVTRGADGARVVQGETAIDLAGVAANVVDPTGAGDAFCGATLAGIAAGRHPAMAARAAIPVAAGMTERPGPAALLEQAERPGARPDLRVNIDQARVAAIARLIGAQDEVAPFPFTGPDLPPPGHPAALDYFFATALQQFGFWNLAGDRYDKPLLATLDGEERKGAFYLFRAYLRWLHDAPERLTPAGQANLTEADLRAVLQADDGTEPMPALDLHLSLARQYGRDMLALELTPQALLERASRATDPLLALLCSLDNVGGYKEDPLRKKSGLLGMILQQRPEAFLASTGDDMPPVVDYHVMRSCLRMGLVDVTDEPLREKLVARQTLRADEEFAIRLAAHAAMERVVVESGKSMGAVDWFFFQARQRCPEMTAPRCDECLVDAACAHRKSLFQPVLRTSYY